MPLQIGAHPVKLPQFSAFHIGRLGCRKFVGNLGVIPSGTDLEDLETLTRNAIADVQLGSDVLGRSPGFNETSDLPLNLLHMVIRKILLPDSPSGFSDLQPFVHSKSVSELRVLAGPPGTPGVQPEV